MIDIHTHILPGIDDGSRSVEESAAMLAASAAQGIACVAATSHFYAEENSPEQFLARRAGSAERLREAWQPNFPKLRLGAEVCYFEGIGRCEEVNSLCIEGTGLLLLEMPFCRWSDHVLHEVWELQTRPGITVLLAHIERYLRRQDEDVWRALAEWGVLNQCNASFFLNWRTRPKALRMLRSGRIHLLGSDCHNMDARPPRLGEALEVLGRREQDILEENSSTFAPFGEAVRA